VTKLQFIRIRAALFTLADEERRHLVKMLRELTKIANIIQRLTTEETPIRYQSVQLLYLFEDVGV